MKGRWLFFILALLTFSSCKKDDFYDKFAPEILFYEKSKVENADFVSITLGSGVSEWTVKARVSAPSKLKQVRLSRNGSVLETYDDLSLTPHVFDLEYRLQGITAETAVEVTAVDMNNKSTTRRFTVKVQP
ncbi:hypothetical protein [Chitinophaga sp.]|uniref:hypothetical protein n=1 Tax=Chitinophaga sp. TaxID=1869181 RepID=UPI0031D00EA8